MAGEVPSGQPVLALLGGLESEDEWEGAPGGRAATGTTGTVPGEPHGQLPAPDTS